LQSLDIDNINNGNINNDDGKDSNIELENFAKLKKKYPTNPIITYLNINSIRNKFNDLNVLLNENSDIINIAETKIDSSFPSRQFTMNGYKIPYRLDHTDKSGGLLTYIKSYIPSKLVTDFKFPCDIQILPIEINFRKCKWLLMSVYRPPRQDLKYFLSILDNALFSLYPKFENVIIIGDFNCSGNSNPLIDFVENNGLSNIMHKKTCFKSKSGSNIDLILTNRKTRLMQTNVLETGLSDHHLLVYTMLRTKFPQISARKIEYRCYKNFDENTFLYELSNNLSNSVSFCNFYEQFNSTLNKHAPVKTKFLRANNSPHVTKSLRKAIMNRSRLKNIANKSQSRVDWDRYRKQRNLVVKLNREAKATFFAETDSSMGKSFWKSYKNLFSDKATTGQERILLTDTKNFIKDDLEIVNIFNNYFVNITDSLTIPPIPKTTSSDTDPVINIIENFANHPSIINIKTKYQPSSFEFSNVTVEEVRKEVLALNPNKKVGDRIPIRILKLAINIYVDILTDYINEAIDRSINWQMLFRFIKEVLQQTKVIIGPSVFFLFFPKFLND